MPWDTGGLITTGMLLREASPQAWDNFVQEMRKLSASVNAEMIKADPALLMRAQGMAIMANEIALTLVNAPEHYDRMRNGPRHPAVRPETRRN